MTYISRKHDNFIRLSSNRILKINEQLRLIRNFSNLTNYDYTIEEVNKLISEIQKELDLTKSILTQRLIDRDSKPSRLKELIK